MSNTKRWLLATTAVGRVRTKLVQASNTLFNPGRAWAFA